MKLACTDCRAAATKAISTGRVMSRRSHRHCMIVHNYYPIGEPRVQRQAEALAEAGAEVSVICLRNRGEDAAYSHGAISVYRLPVRRDKQRGLGSQFLEYVAFFLMAAFRVTWLHLRRPFQVVQVHNLPDFLVFAAIVPRLTGASIILDLHDLMPEFFSSRFGATRRWLASLVFLQERLSCRMAHHVITVTRLWRDTLVQRGVPPDKCSVVMNVADDRVFSARPARKENGNGIRLIYHGNITRRNGLDLALQALARARQQAPGLQLTLHGWGEYLPALQQLALDLGLQDVVTFSTQLLPSQELPHLLASADIGLIPYRRDSFNDGVLPTKLMEYAALGLPAIVARTPVIEAYFASNMLEMFEAGNVASLADCMLRLSCDSERRARLARSILEFNSRYNWAAQRAAYLALVTRLAHPRQAAPASP